jgi:hypothetical protein
MRSSQEGTLRRQSQQFSSRRIEILCAFILISLLLVMTSCQLTQSAFARTTNNAGAALAAASLTLSDMHQGKVTSAYARSAFANYQSELSGLDQQLPAQKGAPDVSAIQQLLSLYKPAMQVINQPCLDASCVWYPQLISLNRARDAFLKAGES